MYWCVERAEQHQQPAPDFFIGCRTVQKIRSEWELSEWAHLQPRQDPCRCPCMWRAGVILVLRGVLVPYYLKKETLTIIIVRSLWDRLALYILNSKSLWKYSIGNQAAILSASKKKREASGTTPYLSSNFSLLIYYLNHQPNTGRYHTLNTS